jgi:hypothetical protein
MHSWRDVRNRADVLRDRMGGSTITRRASRAQPTARAGPTDPTDVARDITADRHAKALLDFVASSIPCASLPATPSSAPATRFPFRLEATGQRSRTVTRCPRPPWLLRPSRI